MKKSVIQEGLSFLVDNKFKKKGSVYVRQLNDEILQSIYIKRWSEYGFDILIGIYPVMVWVDLDALKVANYHLSDFTYNLDDDDWYFETGSEEELKKVWEEKYFLIKEQIVPALNRIGTIHELVRFQENAMGWWETYVEDLTIYYPFELLPAYLYDKQYDTAKVIIRQIIDSNQYGINAWLDAERSEEEKEQGIRELENNIRDLQDLYNAIEKNDQEIIQREIFREYDQSIEEIRRLGLKIEKKF